MTLFEDPRNPSDPLPIFLIQVILVLVFTRALGRLIRRFHQPSVVGEILGGIILGPSVLGRISWWSPTFFPTFSLPYFALVANLGLILFMFFIGMEVDATQMKHGLRVAAPIAMAAIIFPFATGAVAALWLYQVNANGVNFISFILFFAASMSFTAFPVLASILHTFKLLEHPVGVLAFASAAINDVAAWCVLAVASAFVTSNNPIYGLYTTLIAVAFALFMFFIVRPLLIWIHPRLYNKPADDTSEGPPVMRRIHVSLIFVVLLVSAFLSQSIGIHAFFGAYIAGVIVPKQDGFVEALAPKIELVVVDFLLPLYFVNNGLNLSIQSIATGQDIGVMFALIFIASFGKIFPTLITTKLTTKESWRFCSTMGVLMNTRGLVELIVLNVGLNLQILSPKVFAMMVVMAVATTAITPPIVYLLASGLDNKGDHEPDPELQSPSTMDIVSESRRCITEVEDSVTAGGRAAAPLTTRSNTLDDRVVRRHGISSRTTTLPIEDDEEAVYTTSLHHGSASVRRAGSPRGKIPSEWRHPSSHPSHPRTIPPSTHESAVI